MAATSMHTKAGMKSGVEMAKPTATKVGLPKPKSEKPPMNVKAKVTNGSVGC